jgi:N-acetylglucosaminyl-diphospho-decaprenol L-rhamnosyltransferase
VAAPRPPLLRSRAALVTVVVVSHNSAEHLRACVEPLARAEDVHVVVVDNGSSDDSVQRVSDLPVSVIEQENRGFAAGCNAGWRAHDAPFVLFLNPDATIEPESVRRLAEVAGQAAVGGVGPRILEADGSVAPSQRRFPRPASTFSEALLLHRLFRNAAWSTELVRDATAYAHEGAAEWLSGACILVRRELLERIGGLDEDFFLYGEDTDLCRRIWDAGYSVRFEPRAVARHHGGASAPRAALLPVLAASRILYAHKHSRRPRVLLERAGVALGALVHMLVARGGYAARAGHGRALRVALSPIPTDGGRRFVRRGALSEQAG